MKDPKRANGRTTRLADFYIQELFMTGEVEVRDHWDYWHSHQSLRDLIVQRIRTEHPHVDIEVTSTNHIKLLSKEE